MNPLLGGGLPQRLRLASGLVLFTFAGAHFLNHALGLVSLEAMHEVQAVRTSVTRSLPVSIILGAALLTHISLGLHRLVLRRTLRMPLWEVLQVAVALAIPFLLFPHIVNTRVAHAVYGVADSYSYELTRLYPERAVSQSLLLLLVWTHGCLGLHYWLRLADAYARLRPVLVTLAIAVPVLALAGFVTAGRLNADIMGDPVSLAALKARAHWPSDPDADAMAWMRDLSQYGFAAVLLAVALMATLRWSRSEEGLPIRITYADGRVAAVAEGMTILEASRRAGIPHASTCGGRARCFACRVRVDDGLSRLPAPNEAERIALAVLEAPPNIRLACQVRPQGPLSVTVLNRRSAAGAAPFEFMEVSALTAAHARALLSAETVDVHEPEAEALARWFASKLPGTVEVPDFRSAGLVLTGGRIDYLRDRPTAALAYVRGRDPVTVHVVPAQEATGFALRGSRNGYHVVGWSARHVTFYATSAIDSALLDALQGGGELTSSALLGSTVQQGPGVGEHPP